MMTAPILAAAIFCSAVTFIHAASILIAIARFRSGTRTTVLAKTYPAVSIVRPLCGIDNYATDTLRSTFELDCAQYEVLFCVAAADDPVLPLAKGLMAEYPHIDAQLLIGDDRVSPNPKLNNVVKGWHAATHPWIIIADSNVLMPRDYVHRLFASWRADTGLVASPPIGCRPDGIWAELECAFLNTYQARWQYLVDSLGYGFAQGKTMLWRRADLDRAGGIEALAKEIAEDAAATKIVRDSGLKVRLIDRPLAQPLGKRSAGEVWYRQLRWARLRRASFLPYFLPEILSGGILPMIGVALLADAYHGPIALYVIAYGAFWYGAEMLLSAAAGWHVTALYPLYGLLRDLLIPPLFVQALQGNGFVWRGNAMEVEHMQAQRQRVMARMRPRVREVADGGRRRLRSLREHFSER
ncbi:MAG TPA: ceramide glucosyltransferase [Xanthobacteraceae bacterium]|jgi:ceramide glucosyltransferase|nr:ceramide glucosyltransferase [Xanthobacteraceae bacterium]